MCWYTRKCLILFISSISSHSQGNWCRRHFYTGLLPAKQLQQCQWGGCTFLSHTVRARKKLVLMCLQAQTQTVWRGLAFLCFVPSSTGLADQVHWYLLPTLESFVCFLDIAGWNLFKHFICWCTRKEDSSLTLSLTSVAWHSSWRMKKDWGDSFEHLCGTTPKRTDLNSCF